METVAFVAVLELLSKNRDSVVELGVLREQDTLYFPARVDAEAKLGFAVSQAQVYVCDRYNFFQSFSAGSALVARKLTSYVLQLKLIFSKSGLNSIGGLGAIGKLFPAKWDWYGFWMITAFLSVMFAVLNVLPIPILDGGHILFILYEVIFRRKPNEKFLEYALMTGLVLLVALMVYANGMDLVRFIFR
jgi:regulator of sigma E protease